MRSLLRILLVVLAVGALLYLVAGRRLGAPSVADLLERAQPWPVQCRGVPAIVPTPWVVENMVAADADGDDEEECVVIYRYDHTPRGFGGVQGGVVYDPQPDRSPANLETPVPFRPSAFIPYPLLPRGGGQGYLGENLGDPKNPHPIVDAYNADGDLKDTPELVIQGYSGYGFPTYLAIFRWANKQQGYCSAIGPANHCFETPMIFADAGFDIEREEITKPDGTKTLGNISRVFARRRVYDRPHYARSQLALQTEYVWGEGSILLPVPLSEDKDLPDERVVFAFGRPSQAQEPGLFEYVVMHPEAAVLAHYRDGQVMEIHPPEENLSHPEAPVLVLVKVKRGDAQALETWFATRVSTGKVRDSVIWRLQKQ